VYQEHAELLKRFSEIEGVSDVSSNVHMPSVWLTFGEKVERVNMEVSLEERSGVTEVIIKNITSSVRGKGMGKQAVEALIVWASNNGWEVIIARDVAPDAKDFWKKRGFQYDDREENTSNDWIYRPE
jgi:predicted acetyltransferase